MNSENELNMDSKPKKNNKAAPALSLSVRQDPVWHYARLPKIGLLHGRFFDIELFGRPQLLLWYTIDGYLKEFSRN